MEGKVEGSNCTMVGHRKIGFILIFGLCLRLMVLLPVFQNISLFEHNDTASYLDIARNLILGQGYSHCEAEPFYMDSIRTPGYPVFLSLFLWISDQSHLLILLIQILLDVMTIYLVYLLALFWSKKEFTALIAAGLYAMCSHGISYAGLMIPECLYTFLLTLLIYLLSVRKEYNLFLLVLLTTILCYIRPITMYALILFIPLLFSREKRLRRISLPIISLILLVPWMYVLKTHTGHFTFTSISAYNVQATYGNALEADLKDENETSTRDRAIEEMSSPVFGDCNNDYRYIAEMKANGIAVIRQNPLRYVRVHIRSWPYAFLPEIGYVLRNWEWTTTGKGTLAVLNKDGLYAGVNHFFQKDFRGLLWVFPFLLIWSLVLNGFVMGIWRRYKEPWLLMFLCVIVFYSLIPGPATTPRFLTPVVPLIIIISAIGLEEMRELIGKNRNKITSLLL